VTLARSRLRATTQQKMLILGVATDDLDALITRRHHLGLPAEQTVVRAGTMACTGTELRKLAITETKHRAR
jgi:sulfite reductase (ferredoxin)